MKKILLLLLLACLLCGCTRSPGQNAQTEPIPTESLSQPTAGSTEITEEPAVSIPETVELQAVNTHGFRKASEAPQVAVLDHRTAAFLTTEYPDNDFSRKCTRVQVWDLHVDLLIRETLLEGTYTLQPNSGAPGHIVLVEPESRNVMVLDQKLREVLAFQSRDPEGILVLDAGIYYFTRAGQLYWQNTGAEGAGAVYMEYNLTFRDVLGYDPEENVVLADAYAGEYSADPCICAVDLDTEKVLLLLPDVTGGRIAQGGVLLENHDPLLLQSDVYYGDWTEGELRLLPAFMANNLDYASWHIDGSDYVCRFTYDEDQKVDIVEFELFRLGQTLEVCSLQTELDGAKITRIHGLPGGDLLALEVTARGYRTYLICPALLEFRSAAEEPQSGTVPVDPELEKATSMLAQWEIPPELEPLRQRADELEAEYGITILLSGQCAQATASSGMTITTTDQAGLPDEAAAISDALDRLEAALKLYPEDFFRQFQNEAGERGLLVLLVEDFEDERNVIGLCWTLGQWYPIAVDITSGQVEETCCHEIWHATENRIRDLDETALDLAAWEACNPAGFHYSGDTTSGYLDDTANTYLYGAAGEAVYFVDPYAKTKPQEDRARLMEYVMCTEWDAKMMLEHPVMAEKLRLLCDAIRSVFDTEQWEYVHWERFF